MQNLPILDNQTLHTHQLFSDEEIKQENKLESAVNHYVNENIFQTLLESNLSELSQLFPDFLKEEVQEEIKTEPGTLKRKAEDAFGSLEDPISFVSKGTGYTPSKKTGIN